MKPTYVHAGSDKLVSLVEKEYKSKWTKHKFNTFEELEEYWELNFDKFADNNLKTKVIGTTLYVFKIVKLE